MRAYRKIREITLEAGEGRLCCAAATVLPAVMWRVGNVPSELGDIVKISNQSVENAIYFFFLMLIVKFQEKRN